MTASAADPEVTVLPVGKLPVQLTSFVGREAELGELARLVRSSRLVTVSGGAGLGKTRLAIEAAGRLLDVAPRSIRFVSLGSLTDGPLVAQEIASSLGVREKAREPLIQTLAARIGEHSMLLLVDNCEHLVDACARLVYLLLSACTNLRVLATSRQPLRVPGEVVWRIPPLSLADPQETNVQVISSSEAVRLFETRARLVEPNFEIGPGNADVVALLCRRLDGIPLAIELAAARTEMMSVEDIVTRLEDRLRLLASEGSLRVPRHQTLQAALDWGHQLLDDDERRVFQRISVFAGGFDLAAADAVCGAADLDWEVLLANLFGLVEKSLLVPDTSHAGPTRYRLLETVRHYGAERLAESGEAESLAEKHAAYYLSLAEGSESFERGPDQQQWLERLESEQDNFRAALEWCRAHDSDAWLRMASSLTWFWVTRGYFTEGRAWLDGAIAAAPEESAGRIRGLLAVARLIFWQGDYDSASSLCRACLDLCRRWGDEERRGWALTLLGSIHAYRGEYQESQRQFEEVLASVSDVHVRIEALVGMSEMLIQQGELAQARFRLEEVLELAHGPEAPRGRAALFLGLVAFFSADYRAARGNFAEGLDIFARLGNRYAAAGALEGLAALALVDSDPVRALRLCGAAAALRESTGAQLAPRWREVLRAVVIEPAFNAAGKDAPLAWEEGEHMTFDEAIQYAQDDPLSPVSRAREARESARGLAGLTSRELEVAELVAQGMTNREIAHRLVIAERTVEGHVERLRNKLKVRSRTQVGVAIVKQRAWPTA